MTHHLPQKSLHAMTGPHYVVASLSLVIALAISVLATTHVTAAENQPMPFSALYSVYLNGFKVGELKRSLSTEADGFYVLEHVAETTGLVALFKKDRVTERSTWIYDNGQAQPVSYQSHYTGRAKESVERIDFDWQRQVATSLRHGEVREVELTAGMMDKLMHQLFLSSDIAAGRDELSYTLVDRGIVKNYVYELIGTEELMTARGKVNTVMVKRKDITFWLAPDWDYLLVKLIQENDDGTIATYIQKAQ